MKKDPSPKYFSTNRAGSLSHDLQGFIYTSQVVVWDFFHQQ